MPTRKLMEVEALGKGCTDSDHTPKPYARVPGTYEHWCPRCGSREIFVVEASNLDAMQRDGRTVVGNNR